MYPSGWSHRKFFAPRAKAQDNPNKQARLDPVQAMLEKRQQAPGHLGQQGHHGMAVGGQQQGPLGHVGVAPQSGLGGGAAGPYGGLLC